MTNASAPADAKLSSKASCASLCMFVIRRGMFLLSLTATCQVYTVSLKAGLYTYNGFARGALDPPDGDATQADTGIMRVARQAPTAVTGRLVEELKAEGEKEREYEFNKGLAVAKQLQVGRFVSKIDGDGPVFAGPFGGCASHPPGNTPGAAVHTGGAP